jgi:hypothetical protein
MTDSIEKHRVRSAKISKSATCAFTGEWRGPTAKRGRTIPSNGNRGGCYWARIGRRSGKKLPFSACNKAATKPRIYVYIIDMILENVKNTESPLDVCAKHM